MCYLLLNDDGAVSVTCFSFLQKNRIKQIIALSAQSNKSSLFCLTRETNTIRVRLRRERETQSTWLPG